MLNNRLNPKKESTSSLLIFIAIKKGSYASLFIFQLVEGEGFEPPNPKEQIYSLPRLASFATPPEEILLNWLREKDLNLRPSGYEPDELPDCSIPRCFYIKKAKILWTL